MDKNGFLKLGEKVEGFKVVNPDRAPVGLTAMVLWDLWDMGVKFGQFTLKGIGFKTCGLFLEAYKFDHKGGHNGFTVCKVRESGVMEEGVYIFELQNGMNVLWDKGFSVADVQEIIKLDDEASAEKGEKIGGSRIILLEPKGAKPKKMSVERTFRGTNAVMPIMPDLDINGVLSDFDHPELLDFIPIGPIKLLCLKSEKEALVADQERKVRILEGMGLNLQDIEKLSIDDIVGLKQLISQRPN